ncbi:MAG TPA: hypothetical protein DCY02_12845 [Armatimonadetes bacterium]|nr:hypothetical protein [Armatimonadota bacterium]
MIIGISMRLEILTPMIGAASGRLYSTPVQSCQTIGMGEAAVIVSRPLGLLMQVRDLGWNG